MISLTIINFKANKNFLKILKTHFSYLFIHKQRQMEKLSPSWEEYEKIEKLGTGSFGTVYKCKKNLI